MHWVRVTLFAASLRLSYRGAQVVCSPFVSSKGQCTRGTLAILSRIHQCPRRSPRYPDAQISSLSRRMSSSVGGVAKTTSRYMCSTGWVGDSSEHRNVLLDPVEVRRLLNIRSSPTPPMRHSPSPTLPSGVHRASTLGRDPATSFSMRLKGNAAPSVRDDGTSLSDLISASREDLVQFCLKTLVEGRQDAQVGLRAEVTNWQTKGGFQVRWVE